MAKRSGPCGMGWTALLTFLEVLALLAGAASAAAQVDFTADPTFRETRTSIFSGLANQIGTLPNPSGGGFTYRFDPALGVFSRTTESLGPVFADRADTTGRGRFTLIASYSRYTFDELDGVKLNEREGIAVIAVGGIRVNQLVLFEDVTADVFTLGALYGITDRIDVGVTLPILRVSVKERVRRVGFQDCDQPRTFTGCDPFVTTNDELIPSKTEQTGLGDVVLRGKYNFLPGVELWGGRIGAAALLDVKLPTGDKGDRDAFKNPTLDSPTGIVTESRITLGDPPLGTGIVRVKPQLLVSGSWAGFSPHINVGVELGKTEGITNDVVYAVGFDYTLFRRVLFSADLLGRHALSVDRNRIDTLSRAAVSSLEEIDRFIVKANPDTLTASLGVKVNPVGTLLVFVNFLLPLNNTGLRDGVVPTFGVEWSF